MSEEQKQLQVKVSDEVLKGVYANMVQVGHSQEEFVLDFMNIFPPAGVMTARVIVSPSHFKRMVRALNENLKMFEDKHGEVKVAEKPDQKFGFRTE